MAPKWISATIFLTQSHIASRRFFCLDIVDDSDFYLVLVLLLFMALNLKTNLVHKVMEYKIDYSEFWCVNGSLMYRCSSY